MQTIGFLELNSISRGLAAADAMLKAAEVRLAFARPGCPGKYQILVTGEVSAVQSSVEAGQAAGGGNVLDWLVLPRIHPQVIEALYGGPCPERINAVGMLEFFSVTASLQAADAAVKAADVTLLEIRLGTGIGGKSFVVFTGDVSAVEEGVACGTASVAESGLLVGTVVIPSPDPALFESLF